ncbi:bidirectional sugar transporter sweet14 [Nicotiana attenuata]|uniref:Sugar transporter SWEET1 n=1 Tax=Nicotiana attenuata TaxID=49451 RepID=A0A1J6K7S2_NICAT|nr:bidirectional sugar transporter sweet14 [Nicotiana attenuata]
MVYLAPVPTFYKIYKKKSTEGFQSVPYVVGLFSAMLWTYYAFLKPDTTLLITINSVGCCIQFFYICFFLFYATKKAKRQVIKTKSVEYMPFLLSFFLTLSAVMWFFYGLLRKDYNIAIPNVLGFTLGVLQMVLYVIYKNAKKVTKEVKIAEKENTVTIVEEHKISEDKLKEQIIDVVKLSAMVCSEIIPIVPELNEINMPQLSGIINGEKIKPKETIEASVEV